MWIRVIGALRLLGLLAPGCGARDVGVPKTANLQVEQAVLAAPGPCGQAATVLGYGGEPRPAGPLTVLREGTNDLICLADDPAVRASTSRATTDSLDELHGSRSQV